jgi:diguanylate cyclase (GGDEF)-like protein
MTLPNYCQVIEKELYEKVKVLFKSEDTTLKPLITEFLKELGIEVAEIFFSEEIFELLGKGEYQVIIISFAHNNENNLFLLEEIKKSFSEVKILCMLDYFKELDLGRYFDAGADDIIFKPFSLGEFKARLFKLLKEYYLSAKLKKFIVEDPLTKVYNRRCFEEAIREEVYRAIRQHYSMCLLVIDLDDFKWYNDNLGHQAGDQLLQAVGKVLKESVRKKVDKVCRYGGDEFVIILPHTNWLQAKTVAERICQNWKKARFKPVTLSIGIAQLINRENNYEASVSDLIKRADSAMYKAKKILGNAYIVDEITIKYFPSEKEN